MSKDRNIFKFSLFISLGSLLLLLLLNYVTHISPIEGNWLIMYALFVLITSLWSTCALMQYLLRLNAPIKYNLQQCLTRWPLLVYLNRVLPISCIPKNGSKVQLKPGKRKQYDTNKLSVISTVIERKFVSSWYTTYISQDISFPFACKELLDQMINKLFEHCGNIDSMKLVADMLAIILKHIKEYKKATKRQEKSEKGEIDEYYKTIYVVSSDNFNEKLKVSTEHLANIIKIFLKELLPWELWDTPQSSLLISILTRKLDDFMVHDLTQPDWLNDKLAQFFAAETSVQKEETKENSIKKLFESNEDLVKELIQHIVSSNIKTNETIVPELVDNLIEKHNTLEFQKKMQTTTIESALSQMISQSTAPILQRASEVIFRNSNNESENKMETGSPQKTSEPVNIASSGACIRNRKKPRPISEVRIHDRIVEGSVKTWDSDKDLECISLGQDLLASLDGEIGLETRLGRLWEADNLEGNDGWSPNPPPSSEESKSPQLWFGEEDTLDMELSEDSPTKSSSKNVRAHKSHSTNFKLSNIHNIKDLQNISKSTVNQAKHKIGDLQDEAAGVMEGILDLGMAGLRKGLRLTRLQDLPQDTKETKSRESFKTLSVDTKSASASLDLQKSPVSTGSGRSPIHKPLSDIDKSCTDFSHRPVAPAVGALVKQPHLTSQDIITLPDTVSKESSSAKNHSDLTLSPAAPSATPVPRDSPPLEYEDPADLASTIAKLRQLLQQKSSSDTISIPSEDNSSFEIFPKHCSSPLPGPTPTPAKHSNIGLIDPISGNININNCLKESNNGPKNTNISPNAADGNEVSNTNTSVLSMTQNSTDSSPQYIMESKGRPDSGSNTKPVDLATFADEYDDAPVHRAHIPAVGSNNMQRLDRLFTRTVTGVFNTIKTAVGADSPPDNGVTQGGGRNTNGSPLRTPSHHKNAKVLDGWLFVEGEVDACAAIGSLVAEKRNHYCVEAGQDSLEALVPTPALPTPDVTLDNSIDEDYDECGVARVRALRTLLAIAATTLGGPLSRHAVTHCVTVLFADKAESLLEDFVSESTSWIHREVFVLFQRMAQEETKFSKREKLEQCDICEQIVDKIPGFIVLLLGRNRVVAALVGLLESVKGPRARVDLAAQLLDVLALHYMRASILQ